MDWPNLHINKSRYPLWALLICQLYAYQPVFFSAKLVTSIFPARWLFVGLMFSIEFSTVEAMKILNDFHIFGIWRQWLILQQVRSDPEKVNASHCWVCTLRRIHIFIYTRYISYIYRYTCSQILISILMYDIHYIACWGIYIFIHIQWVKNGKTDASNDW